jgi:N utilization substance protein A
VEILGTEALDEETANAIIMGARRAAGWFGDEDFADEQQEAAPGEGTAEDDEQRNG